MFMLNTDSANLPDKKIKCIQQYNKYNTIIIIIEAYNTICQK